MLIERRPHSAHRHQPPARLGAQVHCDQSQFAAKLFVHTIAAIPPLKKYGRSMPTSGRKLNAVLNAVPSRAVAGAVAACAVAADFKTPAATTVDGYTPEPPPAQTSPAATQSCSPRATSSGGWPARSHKLSLPVARSIACMARLQILLVLWVDFQGCNPRIQLLRILTLSYRRARQTCFTRAFPVTLRRYCTFGYPMILMEATAL